MLYAQARSSIVRLCLCALLTVFTLLISPTHTLRADPAESLSTAVIPTMGINDVTEGTLLFKTNQPWPLHRRADLEDRRTDCGDGHHRPRHGPTRIHEPQSEKRRLA